MYSLCMWWQWNTTSFPITFPSNLAWSRNWIWKTISISITVISARTSLWRDNARSVLNTVSISIAYIAWSTNFWNWLSNTVSKSIRIETLWARGRRWNRGWSWLRNLLRRRNRRIKRWNSWHWYPDAVSFSIWCESTCACYFRFNIWKTVSLPIWKIFTWTNWRFINYCWDAASWSITNKSCVTNYGLKWNHTISISITFITARTFWWWNWNCSVAYTDSFSIRIKSWSTCYQRFWSWIRSRSWQTISIAITEETWRTFWR